MSQWRDIDATGHDNLIAILVECPQDTRDGREAAGAPANAQMEPDIQEARLTSSAFLNDMVDTIPALNRRGLTILLVEQNIGVAAAVAEYAHILQNGEIAFSESAAGLVDNPGVLSAYLGRSPGTSPGCSERRRVSGACTTRCNSATEPMVTGV